MKSQILRSLGLLTFLATAAVGCADVSPTMVDDDVLAGSAPVGFFDPSPLFGALGPQFNTSSLSAASNGMLTAAADQGGSLRAVRRARKLVKDASVTHTVLPSQGATIRLPDAGMEVVIPAGALPGNDPIDVTVHAYKGKYHLYEFLPHGLEFSAPVRVRFDITNVQELGKELAARLKDLEQQQSALLECNAHKAAGMSMSSECKKLYFEWADYEEDLGWYQDVVDTEGIVGVYFKGDVHGNTKLDALEIFDVQVEGNQLRFSTTHFSGYALGM